MVSGKIINASKGKYQTGLTEIKAIQLKKLNYVISKNTILNPKSAFLNRNTICYYGTSCGECRIFSPKTVRFLLKQYASL